MFAAAFEYHAPSSVQEAVSLLGKYGDDGKIITGGMSLIPLMKFRLARPAHLIDLRKVADLKGIKEQGGKVVVGARTTHAELEASSLLQSKCPLLAQAAAEIGDQQVRNRGTIGGSIVHGDPGADLPAVMMALDAEMTLMGKSSRTVKAKDFFVDALTTAAKPDEVLVSVALPVTTAKTAYVKLAQQASGFALVGAAVALDMNGNTCTGARVGITGVAPTAFRAAAVEKLLAGKSLDDKSIQAAADAVAGEIKHPLEDALNGSAEYRKNAA
ncbi:MAG TPA: xanthine dehydrogenase family protein subunit M, partial [bacterium]|nr:xanthine dehydrogenase family protein subunit M [bacterium]